MSRMIQTCVIKVVGFARYDLPCAFAGQYLEFYDPDIPDPREQMAGFTPDLAKAKKFKSPGDALNEWHRVRTVDPVRADGRPNKPLTALTVEVLFL